jgi:UDP-2,3-diacylglucosamine pyrophosphatase LpxH
MKYKSIFLSDLHIGIQHSHIGKLNKFLKENHFENIFLVGDVIDMTNLKSKIYWNDESSRFIRRILKESKKKNVFYIIGNHDYFLEMFIGETLSNIKFSKEFKYTTVKGEEILILHGDKFDGVITKMRWLYWLGDRSYSFALFLNFWFNQIRKLFGKRYWSLSKYLKTLVKGAVQFINNFEKLVVQEAINNNVRTIIAGHIHVAEDKFIDGVRYMNCGDWVEQNSCIVETLTGDLILLNLE